AAKEEAAAKRTALADQAWTDLRQGWAAGAVEPGHRVADHYLSLALDELEELGTDRALLEAERIEILNNRAGEAFWGSRVAEGPRVTPLWDRFEWDADGITRLGRRDMDIALVIPETGQAPKALRTAQYRNGIQDFIMALEEQGYHVRAVIYSDWNMVAGANPNNINFQLSEALNLLTADGYNIKKYSVATNGNLQEALARTNVAHTAFIALVNHGQLGSAGGRRSYDPVAMWRSEIDQRLKGLVRDSRLGERASIWVPSRPAARITLQTDPERYRLTQSPFLTDATVDDFVSTVKLSEINRRLGGTARAVFSAGPIPKPVAAPEVQARLDALRGGRILPGPEGTPSPYEERVLHLPGEELKVQKAEAKIAERVSQETAEREAEILPRRERAARRPVE